jgi:hypothetical protein
MDPHPNSVILGLIALNFVAARIGALGGLFEGRRSIYVAAPSDHRWRRGVVGYQALA